MDKPSHAKRHSTAAGSMVFIMCTELGVSLQTIMKVCPMFGVWAYIQQYLAQCCNNNAATASSTEAGKQAAGKQSRTSITWAYTLLTNIADCITGMA